MPSLNLKKAEDILGTMTKKQTEVLIKMFDSVKQDVQKQIDQLGVTKSDSLRRVQLESLVESLNREMYDVYKQFDGQLDDAIVAVCQGVVDADVAFLNGLGIDMKGAYASIPTDVLASIRMGKIYDQKWFLSDAIWSDLKEKQREISDILARGLAMNESPLNIAKTLERFVDPNATKMSRRIKTDYYQDPNNARHKVSADYVKKHPEMDWSGWKQGRSSYYFGRVDYNAQRLARTAIAHAYQQSTIRSAKANPMSEGIKWLSALTERTCEICIDRDGKIFAPDEIPLDHPNGMCTYEIVLPSMEDIADRLADWVNGGGDEGLDNWTDSLFGGKFELKQEFNDLQNQYLSKYGFSPSNMPKDFSDWSYNLSSSDKSDLFDLLGLHGDPHPFQKMNEWYDENLANVASRTVFTQTNAKTAPSSVLNNMFSKARKDAALWFKDKPSADSYFRPVSGKVWKGATKSQKAAGYHYTEGSGKFNRPLRGYQGSWGEYSFKGVGNVDLDYEGAADDIKRLTKLINYSSYDKDVWLQRGVSDDDGFAGFLGLKSDDLYGSISDIRKKIVGKVVKDEAFLSCGSSKGTGFSGNIINVFAPEGTKMIYAEPWSRYSGQGGIDWDGVSGQSYFGSEFETIIQRGTSYRITKIEKSGSRFFVDVEVVGQL